MDKSDGDIEKYLDSFCQWQKKENPGNSGSKRDDEIDGHWDHGLLLTGLNLYDGRPQYDTVIGK